MSHKDYRLLQRGELELPDWRCTSCHTELSQFSASNLSHEEQDQEFNISSSFNAHLQEPPVEVLEEDSIPDASLTSLMSSEIHYEIVPASSLKGKPLLVDSNGYTYNIKSNKNARTWKTTWRCSVRNKSVTCKATVLQDGETFTAGLHNHCHQSQPGRQKAIKIAAYVKNKAKDDVFRSAASIVDEAMLSVIKPGDPEASVPAPGLLVRRANRARETMRPENPQDLTFHLAENFLPPDFLQRDITVDNARHLLFATTPQLDVLKKAKTWYMDGTFKIVSEPFKQLFSIHAFVKGEEDQLKQVPLAFALKSRRHTKDYKAVLNAIQESMQENNICKVVADFEKAMWKAVTAVFPDVSVNGCLFHWSQSVWRKTQDLGLAAAYRENGPIQSFIRKLFALPCLPHEHIEAAFDNLNVAAPSVVQPLCEYIKKTWIENTRWKPMVWSVFNKSVRTNNDVEGWHRRINEKARNQSHQLYKLVPLLHQEAELVTLQLRLVREGKLRRYKRKKTTTLEGKLFRLWDDYESGEISTYALLRKCSRLTSV